MESLFPEHALFLLNKPKGLITQKCLNAFKQEISGKNFKGNMGHTGTLDPFAEGVLLCGIGEGTKLLSILQNLEKEYIGRFVFGATTETLDNETPLVYGSDEQLTQIGDFFGKSNWKESFNQFIGKQQQRPPSYSALHIDGKRSYEWAREGVEKEMPLRECEVTELEVLSESAGTLTREEDTKKAYFIDIRLKVSSGTYIRSLARDWSTKLFGTPGYLQELKRTKVGPFSMDLGSEQKRIIKINEFNTISDFCTLEDWDVDRILIGRFPEKELDESKPMFYLDRESNLLAVSQNREDLPPLRKVLLHSPF